MRQLFLLGLYTLVATTAVKCQQGSPPSSWQQFPQGVAVSLTLNGDLLTANVKNTTNSPWQICGEENHLVCFFYLDSKGKWMPLLHKSDLGHYGEASKRQARQLTLPQGGGAPFRLQIELIADELIAAKTCPVFCRLEITDQTHPQGAILDSTPKMLGDGT
jgi:hypothetical protein